MIENDTITKEDRNRIHKLACEIEYDMGNDSTTEQLCELGERITKYERDKNLDLLKRANILEEWLTEYRDHLKKVDFKEKQTLINEITELLNGSPD